MKYNCMELQVERKDNGKKLYLTKYESENSVREKNILLIHGLTYNQFVFDLKYKDYSLCEFLSKNEYHVWRLDIGGYGKSEKYEDGWKVTTENAAKDVIVAMEEICARQNVESIDLLGWSWGTMISAVAASWHPERVKKIIWLGPCFGGVLDPVKIEKPFLSLDDAYVNRIWQKKSELSGKEINFHTVEVGLQNMWMIFAYTQKGGNLRPAGGAKEIMEAGDRWLIDVEKIDSPVLIIAGDNDFYVNIERCYQAIEWLPRGSRMNHIPKAGHAMYLEKEHYKETREQMLDFLND